MEKSGRTGLIVFAVALALAAPVALTAYVTRDKGVATPTPSASTLTYGDGRSTEAHDLRLTNIQLPAAAKAHGTVSVEILDQAGQPVTAMVREQAKLLHLYVVRTDLTTFQHLYPRLADGTWSTTATLPASGTYRVIAEFTVDAGTHNDHVILGGEAVVPGATRPGSPMRPVDDEVSVAIEGAHEAVESGKFRLHVMSRSGGPVKLGTYLGTAAHVTGFHDPTGSIVILEPLGRPRREPDGTILDIRAELKLKGPYVFFVQARVRGEVRTLRVKADVG